MKDPTLNQIFAKKINETLRRKRRLGMEEEWLKRGIGWRGKTKHFECYS